MVIPDLIDEARAWLSDLQWADDPDIDTAADEEIRRAVSDHYDGGWAGFVRDGA